MISIGQSLKQERESRGVTTSEAAKATRMKVQTIEALEADQFDDIAAPIYVKGFLKLYGDYLDLDTDALVEAYQEYYAPRKRQPLIVDESSGSRFPFSLHKGKTKNKEEETGRAAPSRNKPVAGKELPRWKALLSPAWKRLRRLRIKPAHIQIGMLVIGIILVVLLILSVRGCVLQRQERSRREAIEKLSGHGIIREPPAPYLP